jgi:hypothetical protein
MVVTGIAGEIAAVGTFATTGGTVVGGTVVSTGGKVVGGTVVGGTVVDVDVDVEDEDEDSGISARASDPCIASVKTRPNTNRQQTGISQSNPDPILYQFFAMAERYG